MLQNAIRPHGHNPASLNHLNVNLTVLRTLFFAFHENAPLMCTDSAIIHIWSTFIPLISAHSHQSNDYSFSYAIVDSHSTAYNWTKSLAVSMSRSKAKFGSQTASRALNILHHSYSSSGILLTRFIFWDKVWKMKIQFHSQRSRFKKIRSVRNENILIYLSGPFINCLRFIKRMGILATIYSTNSLSLLSIFLERLFDHRLF